MSKFFTKKKVIIIIAGAMLAVMIGLLIGNNIVNTMETKDRATEKAKIEKTIEEKKEIEKKIESAKQDKLLEEDKLSEEDNYTEEYKEYLKLSDEEKAKSEVIPRKEQVDFNEIKKIEEDQKEDLEKEYVLEEDKQEDDDKEVLPKKYDLRDKININVGNQEQFGLCWDYSTLTSVQTNLMLTQGKEYNLSESHVDYMTSEKMMVNGRKENGGGNFENVIEYNENFKGFVLEEDIPQNVYEDYEYNTFYEMPKVDLYITNYVNFPRLCKNYGETQEEYDKKVKEFQTVVKTHIMNYGSVCASIYSTEFPDLYVSNEGFILPNHMVSIVGWDDTYSKDNFSFGSTSKPEHDGAWIAQNSWGENWGYNGYFYISYDDYLVNREMSGIISINNKLDLLNLNSLGKRERKYIEDNYGGKIVELDGEEYIRESYMSGTADLSNLNLNDIEDIKEYEVILKNATIIDLSNNSLESIDGLQDLIRDEIIILDLSNNNIKDVSCLKDKTINSLILNGNEGVEGYEELKIERNLHLENCGITSIKITDNIENIEMLYLSGNHIEDYTNLSKFKYLFLLELEDCGLTSLEELKDVIKIDTLGCINLSNNKLTDISGLEDSALYMIDLSYNPEIEDFEPLRKAKNVESVILNGCNIKDAKDILLESVTEDYLYEIKEIMGEEYFYGGISYELSDNKGITNLKALKNAYQITVKDCDLCDISELKELKFLQCIDLSHNHNLSGDLSGMKLTDIIVEDCNLDNDFDVFNVESVNRLVINKNDIDRVDGFLDKVEGGIIYMDSYDGEKYTDNGVRINVTNKDYNKELELEIPDEEDLKMNLNRYFGNSGIYSFKVNGKDVDHSNPISIDEETVITYYSYEDESDITLKFKKNKDLESNGIEVIYNLYQCKSNNDDIIDKNNIRVVETYGNGIMKETTDFSLCNDVYVLPSRVEERAYGFGDISHIYVPEKYYTLVSKGDYTAKYTIQNINGFNIIDANLCEDLNEPEDFEEEFPTLTFSSEELYYIAKNYWEGLYVRADDDLLTIELKEYRELNDSGLPMYIPRRLLKDINGLEPMIVTDIYVLMDEENGMDRIEDGDLEVLESFKDLQIIHIITPPEEYNQDDLIAPQDKYTVEIENGVG